MKTSQQKLLLKIHRAQKLLLEELRTENIYLQTLLSEIRQASTKKSAQFLLKGETQSEQEYQRKSAALELYIRGLEAGLFTSSSVVYELDPTKEG